MTMGARPGGRPACALASDAQAPHFDGIRAVDSARPLAPPLP